MTYIIKTLKENSDHETVTEYYNTEHEAFTSTASLLSEEEALSIMATYKDRGYKPEMSEVSV